MHCTINLAFLLNGLFVISRANTLNVGVCSNKDEPLQCCPNYKRRGDICEECWPGTFGEDCKDECPDGYYGRLCQKVCYCGEKCDKVSGCQLTSNETEKNLSTDIRVECPNPCWSEIRGKHTFFTCPLSLQETTNQDNSYQDNSFQNNFYIENVIIASSLAGSFTFIMLIVIYCKLSRNRTSITDSLMNKAIHTECLQARSTPLNGYPHLSPSSSRDDPNSTFHGGKFEPFNPQMCCQQKDFSDNSINPKENGDTMLSSSYNEYSHLNMEVDQYHRLGLTLNNCPETDEELYHAQTSNGCSNNAGLGWSSKSNEKGSLLSQKESSVEVIEFSKVAGISGTHGTPESENSKAGMRKNDAISPGKMKIEPRYIEEVSRKLHSFKP